MPSYLVTLITCIRGFYFSNNIVYNCNVLHVNENLLRFQADSDVEESGA